MAENICHLVLARLPDAGPGTKGISLFLVPKFLPTPDIPSTEIKEFIESVATIDDRMIQLVATDQILEARVDHAA